MAYLKKISTVQLVSTIRQQGGYDISHVGLFHISTRDLFLS